MYNKNIKEWKILLYSKLKGREFMFEIRYADISDAKELAKIHSSSWKIAYKGIVPDEVL